MAGIRIHERTTKVRQAANEFGEFVGKWMEKHNLSWGELMSIFGTEISTWAKYQIRGERHPDDPDKPGDEA